MATKLTASRAEFDRLVMIFEAVPFHGSGKTAGEIASAAGRIYDPVTMTGVLDTQVSRGWLMSHGRGDNRRYIRVIWDPKNTLAELVNIV